MAIYVNDREVIERDMNAKENDSIFNAGQNDTDENEATVLGCQTDIWLADAPVKDSVSRTMTLDSNPMRIP